MKKTRGLSLILCLAVILSMFNFSAYADAESITAYITISMYGDIVKDKDGDYVAERPVTLSGKESYNLDDAIYAAHELYYDGGAAAGYLSSESPYGYGLSADKIWGDTSYNFGYYMNQGNISPRNLGQTVSDGDYIDLYVMTTNYEAYSFFDAYTKDLDGDMCELTLYDTFYDAANNYQLTPRVCAGAEIVLNGELTGTVTDENGRCTVKLDKYGENLISAKKTETRLDLEDEEYEAVLITAPVCIVTAQMPISVDAKYQLDITVEEDIDLENADMIIAGYRDNKLIETVTDIEWSGKTATVYLNERATDIKLFLWNSIERQEPLVSGKVINLK